MSEGAKPWFIRRCRVCSGLDVRRSRSNWLELALLLLLLRPYRCSECNARFYGFILAKKVEYTSL